MAGSTLTLKLNNVSNILGSNTAVVTVTTASFPEAKKIVQDIIRAGGVWADDGNWYTSSAILQVAIT